MKNPKGKTTNKDKAVEYRFQRLAMELSQQTLARVLGVDLRTVQRREAAEITVTNEALLALRAVRHEVAAN